MSIYDAAQEYIKSKIDTVIIAGKNMAQVLLEIGLQKAQDF